MSISVQYEVCKYCETRRVFLIENARGVPGTLEPCPVNDIPFSREGVWQKGYPVPVLAGGEVEVGGEGHGESCTSPGQGVPCPDPGWWNQDWVGGTLS